MDRAVLRARHRLQDTGLFTTERIMSVIDELPADKRRVNTESVDANEPEWRDGDVHSLSGSEIMDAVRKGSLSLNPFGISEIDAADRVLLDDVYGESNENRPGFRTFKRSENPLVSLPNAFVTYHVDRARACFGTCAVESVWVYPSQDFKFISRETSSAYVWESSKVGRSLIGPS